MTKRWRVEVEYWRVEAFTVEADSAEEARDKALDEEFEDVHGGQLKVLDCNEVT